MDIPSQPINITLAETQAYVPGASALGSALGQATNFILDYCLAYSIGSIVQSVMTESQFQGVLGTGWKLCNGQSCAGTAYNTLTGNATVPDFRARFLRGKNNGRSDGKEDPSGEHPLGYDSPADGIKSHGHTTTTNTNSGSTNGTNQTNAGFAHGYVAPANPGTLSEVALGPTNTTFPTTADTTSTPLSEFRMRNIIVNLFLRVD